MSCSYGELAGPSSRRPSDASSEAAYLPGCIKRPGNEYWPLWRRWIVPAALLLALAFVLAFFLTRPPAELRLGRRVQLMLDPGLEIDPALSPDGELVAYAAGPLGE